VRLFDQSTSAGCSSSSEVCSCSTAAATVTVADDVFFDGGFSDDGDGGRLFVDLFLSSFLVVILLALLIEFFHIIFIDDCNDCTVRDAPADKDKGVDCFCNCQRIKPTDCRIAVMYGPPRSLLLCLCDE